MRETNSCVKNWWNNGNLADLEKKLLKILADENLGTELGKNAREKIIKRFSLDRMVDETINVYQEILNIHEQPSG
jgi:glycosyltransferase involved in cell wall biosynthesis